MIEYRARLRLRDEIIDGLERQRRRNLSGPPDVAGPTVSRWLDDGPRIALVVLNVDLLLVGGAIGTGIPFGLRGEHMLARKAVDTTEDKLNGFE